MALILGSILGFDLLRSLLRFAFHVAPAGATRASDRIPKILIPGVDFLLLDPRHVFRVASVLLGMLQPAFSGFGDRVVCTLQVDINLCLIVPRLFVMAFDLKLLKPLRVSAVGGVPARSVRVATSLQVPAALLISRSLLLGDGFHAGVVLGRLAIFRLFAAIVL